MIAVLRRLRDTAGKIRATEWLLLGIETLAVVVGILIAFELEQWADDRREAREVDRTMRELLEEARYDVIHFDQAVRMFDSWIDDAKPHLETLAEGGCPPAAGFEAIARMEIFPPVEPPQSVYDELVAGKGLSSLPSSEARIAVSIYQQQLAVMRSDRNNATSGQRPETIVPADDPRLSLYPKPDNPNDFYDVTRIDYDAEALCTDKGVRNRAVWIGGAQRIVNGWRKDALGRAVNMCQALGDVVGEPCFENMPQSRIDETRAKELDAMGDKVRATYRER